MVGLSPNSIWGFPPGMACRPSRRWNPPSKSRRRERYLMIGVIILEEWRYERRREMKINKNYPFLFGELYKRNRSWDGIGRHDWIRNHRIWMRWILMSRPWADQLICYYGRRGILVLLLLPLTSESRRSPRKPSRERSRMWHWHKEYGYHGSVVPYRYHRPTI